jgi:SAM-dependent methyltransferase
MQDPQALATSLREIYSEHQGYVSDKWASYLQVYERWLAPYRAGEITLLEIGVQNGGSLQIWARYFAAAKAIVGCDINPLCCELKFEDPRIRLVVGDVNATSARQAIEKHAAQFDIIIDDGSHTSSDIISSFKYFYPLLKPGGLYVVEDLHCSYWRKWGGGLWKPGSAMEFFKDLADVLNQQSWGVELPAGRNVSRYRVPGRRSQVKPADYQDMESLVFYNSLCLIAKGREPNSLGGRVVVGNTATVHTTLPAAGTPLPVRDEVRNQRRLRFAKKKGT